jgi:hypothetical protein
MMLSILLLAVVLQLDRAGELSSLLEHVRPAQPKRVRLAALKKLAQIGNKDTKRMIAALTPYAREKDAEIREAAVFAIGGAGFNGGPCPLIVIQALNDPDKSVRTAAATYVGIYERYPKRGLPLLLAAATSKDVNVREAIPAALQHADGKSPKVRATLKHMLSDPELGVRNNAHAAFFQLTNDVHVYVSHLLQITVYRGKRQKPQTAAQKRRRDLEDLLATLGAMKFYELTRRRPKDLATALIGHLSHSKPAIRKCALRQLRAMCISSKSSFRVVDKLKPHKKLEAMEKTDKDEDVRAWAWWVRDILKQGPPKSAPETLPPLDSWEPPVEARRPKRRHK